MNWTKDLIATFWLFRPEEKGVSGNTEETKAGGRGGAVRQLASQLILFEICVNVTSFLFFFFLRIHIDVESPVVSDLCFSHSSLFLLSHFGPLSENQGPSG